MSQRCLHLELNEDEMKEAHCSIATNANEAENEMISSPRTWSTALPREGSRSPSGGACRTPGPGYRSGATLAQEVRLGAAVRQSEGSRFDPPAPGASLKCPRARRLTPNCSRNQPISGLHGGLSTLA